MPRIIVILILIYLVYEALVSMLLPFGCLVLFCGCIYILFQLYFSLYFNSKKFIKIKTNIQEYTNNCNELNIHIQELKSSFVNIKSYDYGDGYMKDNSIYNLKRKEWSKNIKSNFIHNCSAAVCKNASNQPFKYLCKYFNIKIDEDTLSKFENVLNDFSAAEQGKLLLLSERNSILKKISSSIPKLVLKFRKNELINKLGFNDIDMTDLYIPVYKFQYISAGGNTSSTCDIKLNVGNLDRFIFYLSELITFRKSIEGQRALMTSYLREKIKLRDNFTCKNCNISVNETQNLLLEIDHIIPLSKGGVTTEANLQTLCWKCNRTKGAKIYLNT